ncbi:Ribosomal protein L18/L5 [Cynara cardunculus var. scolymus]|uniref:Ribosomal protein L18/L5 n=1 Tax=Cynara cardunculus var. scolymus TaxID=59895 RepID=A0A103XKA6_CYNCS|nr:Ribosomal protein L18/L5 [Cynara cardunculus var. scolymus]
MALRAFTGNLQFKTCDLFGNGSLNFLPVQSTIVHIRPWSIEARARTRVESPKVRNRRLQKKYNGTQKKPRLSVFCSEKQLYAMLVDDQNKKCLFYGSTLQQSIRSIPGTTIVSTSIPSKGISTKSIPEAAQRVGEELVKTCTNLGIDEISSYDRNGFSRGARMEAFEIALSGHGFLFR